MEPYFHATQNAAFGQCRKKTEIRKTEQKKQLVPLIKFAINNDKKRLSLLPGTAFVPDVKADEGNNLVQHQHLGINDRVPM